MLNNADVRGAIAKLIDPVAKGLLKIGITPDAVTYIGTVGASAAALWFFTRGEFVTGVLVMILFIFSDLLDGTMARLSGRAGPWGNYLDSTLDRVADGAVFGSILVYFASSGLFENAGEGLDSTTARVGTAASWVVLVGAFTISYSKARAESIGATANVGIAERAERLIVTLAAAFLTGLLDQPYILTGAMVILAILVVITIGQRFSTVKSQLLTPRSDSVPDAKAESADPGNPEGSSGHGDGRDRAGDVDGDSEQ
jgi:CDP-diacylglycerol--glycerol-3-phosphate 3-phosphatidyltransferase